MLSYIRSFIGGSAASVSVPDNDAPSFREVLHKAEIANPTVLVKQASQKEQERKAALVEKEKQRKMENERVRAVLHLRVNEDKLKNTWWVYGSKPPGLSISTVVEESEQFVSYVEKGAVYWKTVPVFTTTWKAGMKKGHGRRRAYPKEIVEMFYEYYFSDDGKFVSELQDSINDHLKRFVNVQSHKYSPGRLPNIGGIADLPVSHVMIGDGFLYNVTYLGIRTILDNPNGPLHNMQIELSEIPLKYRYRVDTVQIIPMFIEYAAIHQ